MQTVEGIVTALPSQLLQGITCSTQLALERLAEGTQSTLEQMAEGLLARIRRLEQVALPPTSMPTVVVALLACQGYLPQAGQLLCAGLRTGLLPPGERLDLMRDVAGALWQQGPPTWSTLLTRIAGGLPPNADADAFLDSYNALYYGLPYEIYDSNYVADPPEPRMYAFRQPDRPP